MKKEDVAGWYGASGYKQEISIPPTKKDWDIMFQLMFDKYFNPPLNVVSPVCAAAAPRPADPTGTPSSTIIDQDAPSASTLPTQETQSSVIHQDVKEHLHVNDPAFLDNNPFLGVLNPESSYQTHHMNTWANGPRIIP
nr:hypothetical protein [Tanacetum cinerariifolium]